MTKQILCLVVIKKRYIGGCLCKNTRMKRNKKTILRIVFAVLSLTGVFLSGSIHQDTHFERVAEYSSQVVTTCTTDKKYCALSFDAPNKPGDYYGTELANLFDVFRSGIVTYGSAMNVNKEVDFRINKVSQNNLSLFFVGAIGSMEIKDDQGNVTGWRHYKYNFDTMFNDPIYNGTDFDKKHAPVVYLSVEQANKLLESKNTVKKNGEYTREQYESLLKTDVTVTIDNDEFKYYVWNIYYNRDFYCKGISDVLGEFVLTSYYQPVEHDLRQIHKSLYFFNEYSYYNQYLMRYLNERFGDDSSMPSIVKNNLIQDIDYDFLLSFFHNERISSRQWAYNLLIISAVCLFVVSLFFLLIDKNDSIWTISLTFLSLFVPYCIFKLVFVFTHDVLFFSQPVCKLNILFVLLYIFIYLGKLLFIKWPVKNRQIATYYEVNI